MTGIGEYLDELVEEGFFPAEDSYELVEIFGIDPSLMMRRNLWAAALNDADLLVRIVDNGEEGIAVIVSSMNGIIHSVASFDDSPYGVKMAAFAAIAAAKTREEN